MSVARVPRNGDRSALKYRLFRFHVEAGKLQWISPRKLATLIKVLIT